MHSACCPPFFVLGYISSGRIHELRTSWAMTQKAMCCRDMLHHEKKNPSSESPERLPEQRYLFWLLNRKLVLSSQMSGPSPSWDSASHRLSTGLSRLPGQAPMRCVDLIPPTVLLCLRGPHPGARDIACPSLIPVNLVPVSFDPGGTQKLRGENTGEEAELTVTRHGI